MHCFCFECFQTIQSLSVSFFIGWLVRKKEVSVNLIKGFSVNFTKLFNI